jgi:hypothetical protein
MSGTIFRAWTRRAASQSSGLEIRLDYARVKH